MKLFARFFLFVVFFQFGFVNPIVSMNNNIFENLKENNNPPIDNNKKKKKTKNNNNNNNNNNDNNNDNDNDKEENNKRIKIINIKIEDIIKKNNNNNNNNKINNFYEELGKLKDIKIYSDLKIKIQKLIEIYQKDHPKEIDNLRSILIDEGWIFNKNYKFSMNKNEFNCTETHKSMKEKISYLIKNGSTIFKNSSNDNSQRNLALVEIEIILKGKVKTENKSQKENVIQKDVIYSIKNNLQEDKQDVLFLSGFEYIGAKEFEKNLIINGNKKECDIGAIALCDKFKLLLNRNLNADNDFMNKFGHTESFIIYKLQENNYLKNLIIETLKNGQTSRRVKADDEIIAIVLHLHSYFDVCSQCSENLSIWSKKLSTYNQKATLIASTLGKTLNLGNYNNGRIIKVNKDTKFFVIASSQQSYPGRREVMKLKEQLNEYDSNLELASQEQFMIQLDPKVETN